MYTIVFNSKDKSGVVFDVYYTKWGIDCLIGVILCWKENKNYEVTIDLNEIYSSELIIPYEKLEEIFEKVKHVCRNISL